MIDPMWFYDARVYNELSGVCGLIAFLCLVPAIIGTICGVMSSRIDNEPETANHAFKIAALFFLFAAIFCAGYILIPDKETMIQMQIAKLATPENADYTVETIKNIVDYIVEKAALLK